MFRLILRLYPYYHMKVENKLIKSLKNIYK